MGVFFIYLLPGAKCIEGLIFYESLCNFMHLQEPRSLINQTFGVLGIFFLYHGLEHFVWFVVICFFNILVGFQFAWWCWLQMHNSCLSWIFHSEQFYSSPVFTETRTDMSANLTNFIDRLRILSVGQIMGVIHILQAPPLISPGSDAGLVWITFSSLLIRVSWSMQGPIPHGTQMLSLISSTYSQGQ